MLPGNCTPPPLTPSVSVRTTCPTLYGAVQPLSTKCNIFHKPRRPPPLPVQPRPRSRPSGGESATPAVRRPLGGLSCQHLQDPSLLPSTRSPPRPSLRYRLVRRPCLSCARRPVAVAIVKVAPAAPAPPEGSPLHQRYGVRWAVSRASTCRIRLSYHQPGRRPDHRCGTGLSGARVCPALGARSPWPL